MNVSVAHVFYDVYMGFSHASLSAIMADNKVESLKRGEIAVFVNKSFSSVKLLTVETTLMYHRGPGSGYVTPEVIRYLPTLFGAQKLTFSKNLEKALLDAFGKSGQSGKTRKAIATAKRLKVVGE